MRLFWRIIVVTGDIIVTANNNKDIAFTNCALLSTCKTEINDLFKQNNSTKFETECIKSSLWDYFSAFTLFTGDITVTVDNNTDVAFRNCAPFSTYEIEVNDLLKEKNYDNFGTKSIKSSFWDYFEEFFLIVWYITVTADNKNNTDVAFLNSTPFSTCKTPINYLFEQNIFAQFETESIKSSLWDYFEGFNLTAWYITVQAANNNTHVAFINSTPFSTCNTPICYSFDQNISANLETESIKSNLWGYFDAFFLVIGDITITAYNNTYVAFTNCALFSLCETDINDLFKQSNCTKFETKTIKSSLWDYFHTFTLIQSIKWSLWDYFDAFILVTGDITLIGCNKTDVAFKNYEPLL